MLVSNQLVHPISYCLKNCFIPSFSFQTQNIFSFMLTVGQKHSVSPRKIEGIKRGLLQIDITMSTHQALSIPTCNFSWSYLDSVFMSVSKISPLTCVLCPNLSQVTQGLCFSSSLLSLLSLLINNFSSSFGLCTTTQTYC